MDERHLGARGPAVLGRRVPPAIAARFAAEYDQRPAGAFESLRPTRINNEVITMQRTILILLAAVAIVVGREAAGADSAGQRPARLESQVPVALDYLLYLPEDYEAKESWPLLLFLHGAGERGSDLPGPAAAPQALVAG